MRGLPSTGIVPEVTFDRLTAAVAPTRVRLMSCGKCQNGFWRQRNVCYVFVTKRSGEFSGLRVSRIGAKEPEGGFLTGLTELTELQQMGKRLTQRRGGAEGIFDGKPARERFVKRGNTNVWRRGAKPARERFVERDQVECLA